MEINIEYHNICLFPPPSKKETEKQTRSLNNLIASMNHCKVFYLFAKADIQ